MERSIKTPFSLKHARQRRIRLRTREYKCKSPLTKRLVFDKKLNHKLQSKIRPNDKICEIVILHMFIFFFFFVILSSSLFINKDM
jgi:hypothetical protein